MDLTPYYGFREDAVHFHQTCRDALAPHGADYYPRFKDWCDRYFFLKHRDEARGVGGVFFDDLNEPGFDASFALTQSVGDAFVAAYAPIAGSAAATYPGTSVNGISKHTAVAAMWSSILSSTGAPCSVCSRAGVPSQF